MKLDRKINSSVAFQNSQSFSPAVFNTLKKYEVKKFSMPVVDSVAFATLGISAIGHFVGGMGLLYEFFSRRKNKQVYKKPENINISIYKPFLKKNFDKNDEKGAETIVPKTYFGKIGLKFAKVGLGIAAVAGVFNGLATGMPLWVFGEGLQIVSAPIIETPLGTGLFGISLGLINLARVLQGDARFIIDKNKFKTLGFNDKVKAIAHNVSITFKELIKSNKEIAVNTRRLFSSQKAEAVDFFKNSVFNSKPTRLIIQEHMNKEGNVFIKKTFLASPYLMHFATAVLSVGAVILITSNLLKKKIGEKIGLRTYEVGNSIDNISLFKYGMESTATAANSMTKLSGRMTALSGLTILSGQPGVDKDWGRGLMWTGVSFLLGAFAIERYLGMKQAKKAQTELTTLMRQWSINLKKLYQEGSLSVKTEGKTKLDSIMEALTKNLPIEDDKIGKICKEINSYYTKKENIAYNPDTDSIKNYFHQNISNEIEHFGDDAIYNNEVLNQLKLSSEKLFGTEPKEIVQTN